MCENRCLLTCQWMLSIIFNRFNQAQSRLKKLINQTNRKRFFPNRTRKDPTNSTSQKRMIPVEHDLRVAYIKNNCWSYIVLYFVPQFSAIMDDTTAVEHVQRQIRANRKPRTALLAEVFGRGGFLSSAHALGSVL